MSPGMLSEAGFTEELTSVLAVAYLHLSHLCKLLQLLRQSVQRWGARGIKRLQPPRAAMPVYSSDRAGHTGSVSPPADMACVGLSGLA